MAGPRPHCERIDGASIVGVAVRRPAAFGRDKAIVPSFAATTTASARRLVLDLGSAPGALQRQPSCIQATGGRAARRVDPSHLRSSRLRSKAVRGAQAAASRTTGRPGIAVGLSDIQAFLDERASAARIAIQAPGLWVLSPREAREATSRTGPRGLPQVGEVVPRWGPAEALLLLLPRDRRLGVIAELWWRRNDIKAELLLLLLFPLVGRRGWRREGLGEGATLG